MTLQQRECLCALACREAMREWRAGKIGNQVTLGLALVFWVLVLFMGVK